DDFTGDVVAPCNGRIRRLDPLQRRSLKNAAGLADYRRHRLFCFRPRVWSSSLACRLPLIGLSTFGWVVRDRSLIQRFFFYLLAGLPISSPRMTFYPVAVLVEFICVGRLAGELVFSSIDVDLLRLAAVVVCADLHVIIGSGRLRQPAVCIF